MKIMKRAVKGWSVPVENKSKTHCDECGKNLWAGPGRTRYCDEPITAHAEVRIDPIYMAV